MWTKDDKNLAHETRDAATLSFTSDVMETALLLSKCAVCCSLFPFGCLHKYLLWFACSRLHGSSNKPSAYPLQDFRCVPCQWERPFTPRMDHTSQNSSDGGGGRLSQTWLPACPQEVAHDEGRPVQTQDPPEPGLMEGRPPHALAVLSLNQIKIMGSSNEYTDGPAAAQRSLGHECRPPQRSTAAAPSSRTGKHLETPEERPNNLCNLPPLTQLGNTNSFRDGGAPQSSRGGVSGQRLLGDSQIIRMQPKPTKSSPEELKPLSNDSELVASLPCTRVPKNQVAHSKCKDCGRCSCPECSRPRTLPYCWMCGRRCVCSMQTAVEHGTCVCCVKGLFYHCSSDDEDTCADKPFSCRQPRCCVRWTAVSLLSLLFPCLLCYLPAKGCIAVCQSCYDHVSRPGCRCWAGRKKKQDCSVLKSRANASSPWCPIGAKFSLVKVEVT